MRGIAHNAFYEWVQSVPRSPRATPPRPHPGPPPLPREMQQVKHASILGRKHLLSTQCVLVSSCKTPFSRYVGLRVRKSYVNGAPPRPSPPFPTPCPSQTAGLCAGFKTRSLDIRAHFLFVNRLQASAVSVGLNAAETPCIPPLSVQEGSLHSGQSWASGPGSPARRPASAPCSPGDMLLGTQIPHLHSGDKDQGTRLEGLS